jgi:uncharacterized protein YodC (DUF2158 family)
MTRKFKVGDRVRLKKTSYTGVVVAIHDHFTPLNGNGPKPSITLDQKIGTYRNFWEDEFELVSRQKTVGFEITDD